MNLRLVSEDDVDDSLAATADREEEPIDIGQARRRAKRQETEGYYTVAFVPGKPPAREQIAPARSCRRCGASGPGLVLWADPASSHPERVLCPTCQGRATADLIGYQPKRGES